MSEYREGTWLIEKIKSALLEVQEYGRLCFAAA